MAGILRSVIMQEDVINVFCLSHGVSLPTPRSSRVVICKENHVLSSDFPNAGRWFYCCLCQNYWVTPKRQGGPDNFSKQCPSCNLIKKARYYSCDQCNVTMIDSLGATHPKGTHITPWGTPHPHCPGCHQLPKSIPQSHACPDLNGLLTTARAQCPFCEGRERAEGGVGEEISSGLAATAMNEAVKVGIGSAAGSEAADPSYFVLEELESKASEIRALEAEAEAREAKAQERLRQVEARLREEMLRRSELERKSQEIEEELKRQSEIDQARAEVARKASEAALQLDVERKARAAAALARAEAEAKLREMEARFSEAEERLRQAEARLQQESSERALAEERAGEIEVRGAAESAKIRAEAEERLRQAEARLQQEASKRALAEGKANELEVRVATESAKIRAEAEAKIHAAQAEARQIEENYKAEIDWIRAELEEAAAASERAEESHSAEITRITAEAEGRRQQAEANIRQQYQIKVDEAAAGAQAAMFNLEETQKKLGEAEAKCRESEARERQAEAKGRESEARERQAEARLRHVYLASRLALTLIGRAFRGDLNLDDENGKLQIPNDLSLDDLLGVSGSPASADLSLPDGLKALFDALTPAEVLGDGDGADGGGAQRETGALSVKEDAVAA
jgi:hypothetical protein